jgi:uncharacterized integral membrane protein (TIGR00698 family)
VWLGLAVVLVAYTLFVNGSSIGWLAVAPPKWATFAQLSGHFEANAGRYLAQFVILLGLFTTAASLIGYPVRHFVPGFVLVYLLSIVVFAASAWEKALYYNIEPPLIALVGGLVIGNLNGLPRWLDAGFRVEFYIKTGIVLLGATLPFTLIVWAGPVAILQASIVSIATFLVIFFVGRRLGLDQRLAAVLGAGGAVCGVSAAIAIAGAVRAKKEYPPIAITLVVLWAIVMIFVLPLVSRALALPAGVGGAWIGTSEFADAAGFAAAQTYGGFATAGVISGTADQALWSYTLLKVVGRDVWIGIWALVLSVIAVTKWEVAETCGHVGIGEIWWRFPKFVLGFLLASLLVTFAVRNTSFTTTTPWCARDWSCRSRPCAPGRSPSAS